MNNADTKSNVDENASAEKQQAVGQLLREARERAGLEIAEVARVLRISQRYLVALEDGRDDDLPGTAYAIGFARSYAEHLKLDGEEVVRRYKAHAEGTSVKTDLTFPKPIPDSGVPGAAVLGLGVIVAGIAYGAWYWNSNNSDVNIARVDPVPEHMAAPAEEASAIAQEAEPVVEPTPEPEVAVEPEKVEAPTQETVVETVVEPVVEAAPEAVVAEEAVSEAPEVVAEVVAEAPEVAVVEAPIAEEPVVEEAVAEAPVVEAPVVEAAPEPTPESTPESTPEPVAVEEVAAAPVVSEPAADVGDSRITVRAKSNSWIQIRDEALDRLLFTRLLREGDAYVVPNRPGLRLMTGNAGALELLVDGKAIPAIGAIGEVRRNVEMDPDKLKSGTAVTD